MATSTASVIPAPVLSQKQRRAILRKERRKRKRQALAQARECHLNNGVPPEEEEEINDGDDDNDVADEERLRLHEEWLERERCAQEEFRLQVEREEATRRRKEEEERMIKEEWEAQQRREQEEKEQRQQEKRVREEAVQKMLDEAENQLDKEGPWMNPEAPAAVNSENYGTERDVANCPFFLKTGACRFGDRCSRKHIYPTSSPTLMVRGMFTTFGMEQSRRDDYDIDACLEHSEEELQESFVDFYHDVLPEFKNIGKVVQFKVSCNYEPHLRGNVYIQFDTEERCKEAFIKFNGRWYAGRQLHCEICPVTRWKNAICGLFDRQKCTKGKHCNFLHVFRNPGNEFWEADRDLHLSPNRSVRSGRRDGWHSERYGERSWRQRRHSRSPERWESRRGGDRRRSRSRSRERRSSHLHAEDRRSSRSERGDRRKDAGRDRSRSRSRDRDRLRDRSRDQDRESRDRSEERSSRHRDEDAHREAKDKSRSRSRERKRKLSKERSPKKSGNSKISSDPDTRRRHKHSKKSKKKSKKKHKKKSRSPLEGTASSGESEQKDSEDETAGPNSVPSPGKEENKSEQNHGGLDQRVDDEERLIAEVKCEQANPELTGNGEGEGS
ncbi:U2 small nuclear ribonucleoprotein auxiliary factor 35 kDa subunit-related protein 2 [Salarias fasciatus]|uniref:Zinc finger (CCCH type), RNA-binding motif and serine/arginine rich 2 n=1 Tax=Salarias fasciatus TaxID=181472 RepID=A0A672GM63_SALFA|nr:U2 small nuclear ribonucleoprotein auxiliary factor 35 kDa subunit-related protein 2 [Salarias fasciatus]